MEMLVHYNYIVKNPDRKELREHGFRYNKKMSDSEGEFYSFRFPVLQYAKSTTVEGEIVIDLNSGEVDVNAYSYGTKGYYPPFYQIECGEVYRPIIEKINKAFIQVFKKIGVKKVNE